MERAFHINPATPPEVKRGGSVVLRKLGCTVFVIARTLEGDQYRGTVFTGVGGGLAGVGPGEAVTFERQHFYRISTAQPHDTKFRTRGGHWLG